MYKDLFLEALSSVGFDYNEEIKLLLHSYLIMRLLTHIVDLYK